MSYSPQILVPSAHKMTVHTSSAFDTEPTTFIRLYVGMTEDQFHRSSGADRENCKESFSVNRMRDGRYKLTHMTSSLHDRSKRVRGFTGKSERVDQALQRFIDSL